MPLYKSSPGELPQKKILFVTSEMAGYVKAGGLGDVSAALPRALARYAEVRILMPGYPDVIALGELAVLGRITPLPGMPECQVACMQTPDALKIYVLLCPELFNRRGSPYGDEAGQDWTDNDLRFATLSLAAAECAAGNLDPTWRPDLLHLNDWPTALAPAYLAWRGIQVPTVLTIHNLAYQGLFSKERVDRLNIPRHAFRMDGVEFYDKLSFLKAGIFYASHVTTVSTTYADEITTPELGCGLDGLLRTRKERGQLTGILNGIDESWDPRNDSHLAKGFDAEDSSGKRCNSDHVRQAFGLAISRGPLFGVISRLVHQKGIDLTIGAAESIMRQGGQMIVTGRGDAQFENAFTRLAKRFPGMLAFKPGFDELEARRMFAGSDFLLMPSRFEPCGLTQMYAQRYGALPIATRTGGLADTVEDGVTGFLFDNASLETLLPAAYRAMDTFDAPKKLSRMRQAAMKLRYGWERSASEYEAIYGAAVARMRKVTNRDKSAEVNPAKLC
jgi:starch synthase